MWYASLQLRYGQRHGRTVPILRQHQGPLRVQKHFVQPDGSCQHIILHPPGGIAGGDVLALDIALEQDADVLITSAGAAKWYNGFGQAAQQTLTVNLAPHSRLAWLPLETIVFDGAQVQSQNRFDLQPDAALLWGEVVCFGRPAGDKPFQQGYWRQSTEIWRQQQLLWCEHTSLAANDPLWQSAIGLGGHSVIATLLWTGQIPETCHQQILALPCKGEAGATQLPEVWLARFMGDSAEAAWHWLRAARELLYPHTHQRHADTPRIWRT